MNGKTTLNNQRPNDHGSFNKIELEILKLICLEYTSEEIGNELCMSIQNVSRYRGVLLTKTDSRNTAGLVKYAIQNKLFPDL